MALDVSDLMGSTDSSSNDAKSTSDNQTKIQLDPVFENIGADEDRVRDFIDEQGKSDEITNLAKELADDDALFELMEEYRRYVDLKRILQGYLYDADGDFSAFADEFWGDTDDPEPETFNFVQQKARDSVGNLYYYKQMFPEPVEEHWDGEAVLWTERPDDDSDIYVTESFVENFSGFTMEVDGREVPRPPTASELAEMDGDGQSNDSGEGQAVPIDTTEHTIPELEAAIEDAMPGLSVEQTENLLVHEKANKDRKGAKEAIHAAIEAAEQLADESGKSDDSEASGSSDSDGDGFSVGALAGELREDPDVIRGMRSKGLSEDEIREILG